MATISRYIPKAIAVVGVVLLAAAWPIYALTGKDGVLGLILAGFVALVGTLAGRLPHLLFRQGPDAIVHAAMAGLVVRLLTTLALAVPLLLLAPLPQWPMAVGLVVTYLALLVLEVRDLVVSCQTQADAAPPGPESAPTGPNGAPTR